MKVLISLLKKECMEQLRTGKLLIMVIIFLLFGIMNPAIAKLTPWMMEILADSLAQSGMTVTNVTVSAMDSWVQFFKNIPMGLIVFVLLESSIFTKEYESNTLILSLTKGLDRKMVLISKTLVLFLIWTFCYWLCFGITYAYNAYFWDNSVAQNLGLSILNWYFFGLWTITIAVLFSVLAKTNSGVLLGTGGVVFAIYLLSLFPKLKKYLPATLMDGNSLIYGKADAQDFTATIIVTVILGIIFLVASIPVLNRKQL